MFFTQICFLTNCFWKEDIIKKKKKASLRFVIHMAINYPVNKQIFFLKSVQNVNVNFLTYPLDSFYDDCPIPIHFVNRIKNTWTEIVQSDGHYIHYHIFRSICCRVNNSYSNSNKSHILDSKCIFHWHILKKNH